MFSLLTRGGSVAGSAIVRVRRIATIVLTATLISGGFAAGTTLGGLHDPRVERAFGGYSDVKLVRDFQLPTL